MALSSSLVLRGCVLLSLSLSLRFLRRAVGANSSIAAAHTAAPLSHRLSTAGPPADSGLPNTGKTTRRWRMYRSLILDTAPIYPLAIHLGHALFCITSFREWRSGQTKEEPSWMHNLVCSYFCFGFGAAPA